MNLSLRFIAGRVLVAGVLAMLWSAGSAIAADAIPEAAPKGAFVVPFRDKPVILVQGKINGKTFTLGFDTGASHTVLSPETARAAGVQPQGQFGTADISLGEAVLKGQRVAVQAMPQFQHFKMLGLNVGGILGFPFLSQFVITFDYKAKQLTLAPAANAPPLKEEGGSHVVTFNQLPRYGLIFLQAKINGSAPMTFLFDSGAEETILTPATARKLGIKGGPVRQTTVGPAQSAVANSIDVGGSELKNVPVVICDPPQAQMLKHVGQHYDGILGRSFFNKFKITLDYRTKQIKLTPN
jgi:predicted aspartyl protease